MLRFEPIGKKTFGIMNGKVGVGLLVKDYRAKKWKFAGGEYKRISAAELRTIADELDRLNRAGEGK